jgi:hypothetical protein
MKRSILRTLWLLIAFRGHAADSVVVFNEIHYHPATNEAATEWIELHNQMAIDVDLSAWRITGSVEFTFAEGTIIPGGGYLVIASDPTALQTDTGVTNVVGPFTDRLNNSGGTIRLRDRNDRLMDELEYRDGGKWPVAPDGSGATLAKRNRNSSSAPPENWTSSVLVGGTPGGANFSEPPVVRRQSLVALNSLWHYEASGTDLGTAWRGTNFDDSAWGGRNSATLISYWPFNGSATATRGTSGTVVGAVTATTDRNGAANGALAFNGASQQYANVVGGGGLNGASAGTISMWVKWSGIQDADCCTTFGAVLARQGNGLFSDDIIALSTSDPATARVVWRQTGGPAPVLITGTTAVGTTWHHIAITFRANSGSTLYVDGVAQGTASAAGLNNNPGVALSIGAWAGDGGGFSTSSVDDVAIWDQPLTAAQIAQLAAQTKTPLDFAAPENAIYFAGDGSLPSNSELLRTQLPVGPTTYYFRNAFQFGDDPARTDLKLDLAVDDGAVLYLNGVEVYRQNMPGGAVNYSTLAASAVGFASIVNNISLAATNLVRGANVFAVEVHQASSGQAGMVFGAGLTASVTLPSGGPPPEAFDTGLVFNEISAASAASFEIELINRGTQALDACGYVVTRTGVSPDAEVALCPGIIPPGEFLVLDQTVLRFGAAPGDKLFLFTPEKLAVADALEVHERPRARRPDGDGEWLTPNVVTLGASNSFALHDEVVINEIMYHAPPLQPEAATFSPTNTLLTLSNVWRYRADGVDLGTDWLPPAFDDSGWQMAAAMFYAPSSAVTYPAPKNTLLALTNGAGARIITYYFRTQFMFSGDTNNLVLGLRGVIDDGAVFYLNGVEVYRLNMPTTNITYGTLSTVNIGIPGLTGPVSIPITSLQIGLNTLAVEVHQVSTSSSDMNFAAELSAWNQLTPALPFRQSPEQWVELFNRTSNAVNLTGWRLDEGIDFRFATNTIIPAGSYLVVAKDPADLLAKFPGIAVVGPFTNKLSHRGERLLLRDAADNPVNAVHYFDGGRWLEAADAGGSSLELRDPRADNSVGEAWAASDERSRSSWHTYSYRGVATASPVGPDGQWHEFVIGMLDAGEVLLDDIMVIETPSTTPTNLIQNGTFDTLGTNKWRIIGNHHGEVIDDPDQPGNKVLRLVATGGTEHMSNHGETTFVGNRDVVNGREYLISFRAKRISGSRQLNTRLSFNRLARTTLLDAPTARGTPGARNTAFTPNVGPTYYDFHHDPTVPAPFAPGTVSVCAADPDGIAAMTLWWRVDTNAWTSVPMTLDASNASTLQRFSAAIPGKAAGTIIQFYLQGTDTLGATSTFPAAGPTSRALYKVDDGLAATNGLHNIRLIVRTDDANWLHNNINAMSNEKIPCTMISDEREIFYNVGLRLKGSEHSRTVSLRLGFNVNLHSEQLFRGIHRELGIDRSESTFFGQREMLNHQTLNHAGGLPTKYSDLIQIMTPRLEHTGSAELQLARYGDIFLDNQFKDGSDGTVFEYELIYRLTTTDTSGPEGNKIPGDFDGAIGTAIRNLGDDKEGYRWDFLIKNNEDRDDYSRIMQFCKTMELTGTNFTAQITNIIEVDQWLRGVAVNDLAGVGDSYGGDGAQHNVQFYVRLDGKVIYFPHDMDAFFDVNRPIIPNSDLSKLIAVPAYARAYYCHLLDIIATTYNGNYMTRWANHFGRLLPAQNFASHLSFLIQRAGIVTSAVNAAVPNMAFAITSNGGNNFGTTNDTIMLTGTAPLSVKEIQVNGVSYPITWTSTTAWSLRLSLLNGPNALALQGLDRNDQRLTNAFDSITITNGGGGAALPVVINEWMADNAGPFGFADPADGLYQDWFELFNPNTNAVNLAGFFLTDNPSQPTKWQIPLGAIIPAQGFLLVWADNEPGQNATSANGHLHAGFQLNNDGEAIGLFSPGGVAQHVVLFGAQIQNVSQGLFPDGNTNGVFSMTNFTPRAANILGGPLQVTQISFNVGTVTLSWSAIAGRTYRVDFKDDLGAATWTQLGASIPATGNALTVMDPVGSKARRFYRITRLD